MGGLSTFFEENAQSDVSLNLCHNSRMKLLHLLLVLMLVTASVHADDSRPDGNWWNTQSQNGRLNYIVGFYDGMILGHRFSYWKYADDSQDRSYGCTNKSAISFNEYHHRYIDDVRNDQLVDGVNEFYRDNRNHKIRVADAVWWVVNHIAGEPQAGLDKMIENFRKNAD